MTTLLFPLNLYSVIHWQGAFQSCSLPVLTSLPIIQAASQTSDTNSTRLLCKRTLINHQLNQTIYCVISRQLVNTSQILLSAVTALPSLCIPAFQHTTATMFLTLTPCVACLWTEKWVILYNKGKNQYGVCPIIELFINVSFISKRTSSSTDTLEPAPKMTTEPTF